MNPSIAVIVMSGSRERLQMAGMVAAVGAVTGAAVRVFVSMNALLHFAGPTAPPPAAEGPMGDALDASGPPFERFFADAAELGDAKIFPCSLAMELGGIRRHDLPAYFGPPLGVTKFLEEAMGAQVWSF
jgi:peroxiredoxin family protein